MMQYYSSLMNNEMHNSYNPIFIPQFFLSALHVSESSLSSSGAQNNILYTQFGTIGTIVQASLVAVKLDSL